MAFFQLIFRRWIIAAHKGNDYCKNRKLNPKYSQDQIDDIITNLLKYANSDSGLYLSTFAYEQYKQPDYWLYNLADHHPSLKTALEVARSLIAGKITRHCWLGDRNSTFGERILPMYSKDYKAMLEWKETIKQKTLSEEEANIIVQAVSYVKKTKK